MTYINEDGSREIIETTSSMSIGRSFAIGEPNVTPVEPADEWEAIDGGWRMESVGAGIDDDCWWTVRQIDDGRFEVTATNYEMMFGMDTVYDTAEAAKQACETVEGDLEAIMYEAMDW